MKKLTFTIVMAFIIAFGVNAQKATFQQKSKATSAQTTTNQGSVESANPTAKIHRNGKIVKQNNRNLAKVDVFTEDFSGGALPAGWQNIDNMATPSGFLWAFDNPGTRTINTTTGANGFAIFDSDFYGGNAGEDNDLITPAINCAALTTVKLSFEHYFYAGYGGAAEVFVSGDDGTTWTSLEAWSATSTANAAVAEYDITAVAAGQAQVKIKWNWQGDYSWYWAVDDIRVFEPAAHDLAVTAVTPAGHILTGATVAPVVTVSNPGGSSEATYSVLLSDGGAYSETVNVATAIAPGATYDVTFPNWTPADGLYTLTATVTVTGDANAANDVLTSDVDVRPYAFGDVVMQFNTQAGGAVGVATDGTSIYTCYWAAGNNTFDRHDMNGNYVESFNVTGAASIRDLDYDGTNFYGSPNSTSIYKLTLGTNSGTLVSTITAPQATRALAYDGDDITMWGNSGAGNMKEFSMTGTATTRNFTPTVGIYGAAYDNYSDPANPTIWGSDWSSVARLVEWDLTGTPTGREIDLTSQFAGSVDAAGLAIYEEAGVAYLLANFQSDPNTVCKIYLTTTTGADITFNVTDGTNPLAGANVNVAGIDLTTDAGGVATAFIAPGTYNYTVSKFGYTNATASITVVDGVNQNVPVALAALSGYDVTFTVTNNLPAALAGAAIVVTEGATTLNGTTDASGVYTFTALPAATYGYGVALAGYITQSGTFTVTNANVPVNITLLEDMVAVDAQGLDVAADINGTDYIFTWFEPGHHFLTPQWINKGGLTNNDGIGTGSAFQFSVAHRFSVADLADFAGGEITKIKFWPKEATNYSVKVWEGTSATPTEIYTEDVTASIVVDDWTEITLATPVAIDHTQDLWIGYYVDGLTYPAGCDAGPVVPGGNWIYSDGAWALLTDLAASLTYNWNIAGYVDAPATKGFLSSYNVYLDNMTTPVASNVAALTHTFVAPAEGAHTAGVAAMYTTGQSTITTLPFTVVGVKENATKAVSIYPTLTKGRVNIDNVNNANIYVTNVMGTVVASKSNVNGSANFDLSNLASGIYMIQVVADNKVVTKKINVIK